MLQIFLTNMLHLTALWLSYTLMLPQPLKPLKWWGWFTILSAVSYLAAFWFYHDNWMGHSVFLMNAILAASLVVLPSRKRNSFFSAILAVGFNIISYYISNAIFWVERWDFSDLFYQYLILALLINVFCCGLIKRVLHHYRVYDWIESKDGTLILGGAVLALVMIYINMMKGYLFGYTRAMVLLNGFLNLMYVGILTTLIIRYIGRREREAIAQNERLELQMQLGLLETAEDYSQAMIMASDEIRKLSHDFSNIFLGCTDFMNQNDMEGLKSFFYENILPLEEKAAAKELRMASLVNISNRAVRGLLISKLTVAAGMGINVCFELDEVVKGFPMATIDLIRILGCLLDNAIEAASRTFEPQVNVAVFPTDDHLQIMIENNFEGEIDESRLYEKGFSTKGNGRGLGLSSVEQAVGRYQNIQVYHMIKNDFFIQHVEMTFR